MVFRYGGFTDQKMDWNGLSRMYPPPGWAWWGWPVLAYLCPCDCVEAEGPVVVSALNCCAKRGKEPTEERLDVGLLRSGSLWYFNGWCVECVAAGRDPGIRSSVTSVRPVCFTKWTGVHGNSSLFQDSEPWNEPHTENLTLVWVWLFSSDVWPRCANLLSVCQLLWVSVLPQFAQVD